MKKLNYFSAITFLYRYIKLYKGHFFVFYAGWLLDSLLAMLMPILIGIMIDEIIYYHNVTSFVQISLIFLLCILFSSILYFFLYAQHGYLMNMFVFVIRKDVFEHLQKCEAKFMTDISTGEILAIFQQYTVECMHFVIRNMIHMCNETMKIIFLTVYLVMIDWRLGVVAVMSAIFSVVLNMKLKGNIRRLGEAERECYGQNVGWLYEVISALRDIRILGARRKVNDIFDKNQKLLFSMKLKNEIASLNAENVLAFLQLIVQLLIYIITAYLVVRGNVTLGMLLIIIEFHTKLSEEIRSVSMRFLDAQKRIAYIQRIYDFLHSPVERVGKKKLQVIGGEIKLQNVFFGYEKLQPVIKDLTLSVRRGERVAIVGKSGCGKTTLAYLLVGFYRLQRGRIHIDDQDLSDCDLKAIRENVGYVQQDVLIFDGTIRNNLLMGNFKAKEQQMIEACRLSGLGEWIESLPSGLDTVIGSQGIGLSGGQKQRIAIARIYLKNPKIIIFDEATSALDSKTEEAIHNVWKNVLSGKTTIVISHKQSSVMQCDRVLILEDGKIVEEGKPERMFLESNRLRTLFAVNGEALL